MPVSSKKIIQTIESLPKSFGRHDLINTLVVPKIKKKPTHKRKKPYRSTKDIAKIDNVLNALLGIGILRKTKKFFYKNKFILEGTFNSSSTGNGICTTPSGDEIVIKHDDINGAHNNDYVSVVIWDYKRGYFLGYVKNIIKREKSFYSTVVIRKESNFIHLKIIDVPGETELWSQVPKISCNVNDIAIVQLKSGMKGNRQHCEIIESFSMDDEKNDFRRIRIKHSLPYEHEIYEELKGTTDKIYREEYVKRTDFRELFTITIDGADAKDFDDALSIKKDDAFTLYVHIADVSYYVEKNSDLDIEALTRSTSYYLGEDVIPMLPEKLSNNLCSLKKGVDRLALSVQMKYDLNGKLLSHKYFRGIINVDKRLTYTGAEKLLQSNDTDETVNILKTLQELTDILKSKRMQQGRLDLNLSDEYLVFKNHKIEEIKFAERLHSHMIVEECMLSANIIVSKTLREHKVPSLYRIHEDVDNEALKKLKRFLQYLHIDLPLKGNAGINLQKVIDSVSGQEFEQVANLVILKSLMQAYYGISPIGHFGLGFPDYTHFTSPIRRYPDLIVHRCLLTIMENQKFMYENKELESIGEQCSEKERIAQRAERDLIKLKSCRILADEINKEFDVIISGISKAGFFVSLLHMPIEGMVPLKNLTDDYYLIKEDDYTVIGKKYSKRFRLGDHLTVVLHSVDLHTMRIDFRLP